MVWLWDLDNDLDDRGMGERVYMDIQCSKYGASPFGSLSRMQIIQCKNNEETYLTQRSHTPIKLIYRFHFY